MDGMMKQWILALTLLLSTPLQAEELNRAIDRFVQENDFQGVVIVKRGERILHESAHGQADRSFDVANTTTTRFKIASITKLFTAVLVMQAVEQGKLDLDAPIRRYLPSYAGEGGDGVSLRHLLTHTSGIENPEDHPDPEFQRTWNPVYQAPWPMASLMERFASGPLVNEPGSTFAYNNFDFVIVGRILERIHGKPYALILKQELLAPLGLSNSGFLSHDRIVEGLARTYSWKEAEERYTHDLPMFIENWDAAGAMYSSAHDLLRFSNALFEGQLIQPASLATLLEPAKDEYAFGLWVREREIGGERIRYAIRYGRIRGARTVLFRQLNGDVTILVLSNTNRTDPGEFVATIVPALLDVSDD